MTERWSPQRWANTLTTILDTVPESDRFPVNVKQLATEYSRQRFPEDPITLVAGDTLPGFDGALYRAPAGKKGWGIIYNSAITSPGRVNFTLAHEFGHYLVHRQNYPQGIECNSQDMVRWDSQYRQIEQQANEFAATLLMPLNDFRRQITPKAQPTLDDIGACAERYRVSLIAATLRWLLYTERRSVMVVSRDGFILWARSSEEALKTRAYFKTSGRPPIPVPPASLPAQPHLLDRSKGTIAHDAGVWFPEPCEEVALVSDQYDFAISLLHLGDRPALTERGQEPAEDTFERVTHLTRGEA